MFHWVSYVRGTLINYPENFLSSIKIFSLNSHPWQLFNIKLKIIPPHLQPLLSVVVRIALFLISPCETHFTLKNSHIYIKLKQIHATVSNNNNNAKYTNLFHVPLLHSRTRCGNNAFLHATTKKIITRWCRRTFVVWLFIPRIYKYIFARLYNTI